MPEATPTTHEAVLEYVDEFKSTFLFTYIVHWLVPIHSDTLILKTRPTELRVAPSALPRASCGHGR